jgi:hypothetical protein
MLTKPLRADLRTRRFSHRGHLLIFLANNSGIVGSNPLEHIVRVPEDYEYREKLGLSPADHVHWKLRNCRITDYYDLSR